MIFIDTGAFFARYVNRDQFYSRAGKYWTQLQTSGERCVTSNFVLCETFTLLGRHEGYHFASQRAYNIYSSVSLAVLRPDRDDEVKALTLFKKYADQKVSFTDCLSFVLMRKHRIKRAFTFDKHFAIAGFTPYP